MYQPIEPTVESWLKAGWRTYKECFNLLIGGATILSFLSILSLLCAGWGKLAFASLGHTFIIGPMLGVGWFWLCLNCVRRKSASISFLLTPFERFHIVLAMIVIYYLGCFIGGILLIIPGIYFLVRFCLCWFVVMDQRTGPLKTMEHAGAIVQGHKLKLIVLYFVILLMSLPGLPFVMAFQPMFAQYKQSLFLYGLLPYLVSVILVVPLVGASLAAAYESISQDWESRQKAESAVTVESMDPTAGLA